MLPGSRRCSHSLRMRTNRLCLRLPAGTRAHVPSCCVSPCVTARPRQLHPYSKRGLPARPLCHGSFHHHGPIAFCYLETSCAHSPWDFWTGTCRKPLSCIFNVNSSSPVCFLTNKQALLYVSPQSAYQISEINEIKYSCVQSHSAQPVYPQRRCPSLSQPSLPRVPERSSDTLPKDQHLQRGFHPAPA